VFARVPNGGSNAGNGDRGAGASGLSKGGLLRFRAAAPERGPLVVEPAVEDDRWRARPLLAGALVVAVFALPVLVSVAAAALVGHEWAPPVAAGARALRWVVLLGLSTAVFVLGERLSRRALPLTVLLKMGMVFPGRAPKRLSVARRTWTTRDLGRRIEEARDHGVVDEPTAAAEQIVALAATLSAHDRRTRGHAERVRAYTDLMAEELHLPEDDRQKLRWSALLHDVGKLAVHGDILNKAGALSDDEWELMRRHPLEGARLTAPLAGWLGPWANTIAEHHERFDGRGYPYGLAGADISTGGRIVAVADCYDTMTSLRSYKAPMSARSARLQLAARAGIEFDPVMVRALLAVPLRRTYAVAPLAWVGMFPVGRLGAPLARATGAVGRVGWTALAAAACVVALVAGQGASISSDPPHPSAIQEGLPHRSTGGTTRPSRAGGNDVHASRSPTVTGQGPGGGVGPDAGTAGPHLIGTGDGVTGPVSAPSYAGGGQPTGGGPGRGTGPTTTGPPGSTPTTTVVGVSPTTTTTTIPPPPPPVAPQGLTATGGCQVLVIGPDISLSWSASPTTTVTGYVILRGTDEDTLSPVGSVSGRTTTEFTDMSVSGFGTTYWYKVEAVAGRSTALSTSTSATTPSLCVSMPL
jgi:hypothetical protein